MDKRIIIGADDSGFPFPVVRYPSIDTRKKLGYVAGYPFSPETARVLTEQKVPIKNSSAACCFAAPAWVLT